jgi:membrane fusion protein (multidrug efflux system)
MAIGLLAVIGVCAFGYWYFLMRGIVYTDDARLAGHLVDLAPEISGRVTDVLVREGQSVRKGQEVFRLDSSTYRATVSQAEASVLSAKANLQVNQAKLDRTVSGNRPEEIKAAQATLERLEAEEKLARAQLERTQNLTRQGAGTQNELDRAQTAHESALHSRENAEEMLAILQQGARKEDIDMAKAEVEVAKSKVAEAAAALEKAKSDLAHCIVVAPFDGWIVRRWLEAGAMPLPGQPVLSLFDQSSLRVDANIEEKYLSRVSVGDEATIKLDAYPGLRLKGSVVEILRATNSQFSLIPAEGVSGTYIKVSQRVPLRIAIQDAPDVLLAPGLSAKVRIHVGSNVHKGTSQVVHHE